MDLSHQEIQNLAKRAGVNKPVLSARVVGGRVELHLLGGDIVQISQADKPGGSACITSPQTNTSGFPQSTFSPTPSRHDRAQLGKSLRRMTVAQLRQLAKKLGLTGYSNCTKQALIAMILEASTLEEIGDAL